VGGTEKSEHPRHFLLLGVELSEGSVLATIVLSPCVFYTTIYQLAKEGLMAMAYLPIFVLLFMVVLCQSDDRLTPAKPLLPSEVLISDGGVFALGFFSLKNSSSSYVGIWYNNIPERSVVWVANRDNPITTPSVKLAITSNSGLVLSDSQGHTLWTSNTNGGAEASAVLLNSGNFVLRSPNGTEIWRSFDHPTDTILPTMRVLMSYKAQSVTRFFAWKDPGDPSTGDVSCSVDPASNFQMFIWKGTSPYFRFSLFTDNAVSGGSYQSNGISIVMYQEMINTGDELYYTYTVSGSPYVRISFEYTGKAGLLIWNSTTSSWAVISERPDADCELYASCGPFGYCDHTEAVPTCRCLDGFELLDSLNFSRGCRRKEALKCGNKDYFITMPNMKVPDKFLHIRNRSFDQCAAECTLNCSCVAYSYANLSNVGTTGDTSRCLVWTDDPIDMEKASFLDNLMYIRLGQSPGTHIPNTSSSFPRSNICLQCKMFHAVATL